MKLFNYVSIAVIVSSLALSGCTKSDTKETATPAVSTAASIDAQTGIKSMLDTSALFKTSVDAKDAAQVKKLGAQLEAQWLSFENTIKPNYPDDYLKVETNWSPLTIGAKQDSLDFDILTKLNDDLKAVLEQLSTDLADGKKAVDAKALESSPELQAAATTYMAYVNEQGEQLVVQLEKLQAAIASGDLKAAQTAYGQSRPPYERIEPIIETFIELDEVMDARVDDFESDADPKFTGYHRIENILFVKKTLDGAQPFADDLLANGKKMRESIKTAVIGPADFVTGVGELMEEAQTSKITGEEERWSGASLPVLRANVEGAEEIYNLVKDELKKKDSALNDTIGDALTKVLAQIDALSPKDAVEWTDYSKLTPAQIVDLKNKLEALAEPMVRMPGVLGG
ncbi:EfeM/EfeO family lipoprotein [Paenibacillus psychroresistens]|uniref:EfeM/EfeO family lipoprotein n=1 Tax=Paenibacillus psychroresistens TaxID=1778678 RepID=A0A6B8REL4_9BACL|nr:EfeM/EfeO family lipoprotein [Paenibacillus psychroresistens]QGQ94609.1 EfeM/EfeO family lipoprotein [Paenibacillus psychroresistens]